MAIANSTKVDQASNVISKYKANINAEFNYTIDLINGDHYQYMGGGVRFNSGSAGNSSFSFEPLDVGAALFGYAQEDVDSATILTMSVDPYIGLPGDLFFMSKNYPESGYAMRLLNGFGTAFYDVLSDPVYIQTYLYLNTQLQTELANLTDVEITQIQRYNDNGGNNGDRVTDITAGSSIDLSDFANTNTKVDTIASNALGLVGVDSVFADVLGAVIGAVEEGGSTDAFSNHMAKAVMGSVVGTFSSIATAKTATALGITSIGPAAVLGMAINAALTEAMEVAMGLDNHYGFGGELVGTDLSGKSVYSGKVDFSTGLLDMAKEAVTLGNHVSMTDLNKALAKSSLKVESRRAMEEAAKEINAINSEYGLNLSKDGAYAKDMASKTTSWAGFKEVEKAVDNKSAEAGDGNSSGGVSANDSDDGASTEAGNSAGGAGTNAGGTGGLQR